MNQSRREAENQQGVKGRGITRIRTQKPRVHPAAGGDNPVTFTETTRVIRPSSSVDLPSQFRENTETKTTSAWRRVALLGATVAVCWAAVALKHSENFPENVARATEGFLGESAKLVKIVKNGIKSKFA